MSKMLWEVKAPLAIAKAKEDMGLNNIFKYMRYYRMYIDRVRWTYKDIDLTNRIENKLFWRGKVALVNDPVYELVVCEIDVEKRDPNGTLVTVDQLKMAIRERILKSVKMLSSYMLTKHILLQCFISGL